VNANLTEPLSKIDGIKFDHVAIAAKSILSLTPLYVETLGGKPVWCEVNVNYGFRAIGLIFDGGGKLEMIEALPGSDFLDKFLSKRPDGGVHHLTFRVPDIFQAEQILESNGFKTFGKSTQNPTWFEFFVDVKDASGVLVQIAQSDKPMNIPLEKTVFELLAE
jgi:methylmalonyl-CoA/ethylmalonyl-CoA epimerase